MASSSMTTNFTAPYSNGLLSSTTYLHSTQQHSVSFLRNPSILTNNKLFQKKLPLHSVKITQAQGSNCVSRSLKWWVKNQKANMTEIKSAQQLVESLANAGDKLVILNFYSPGCGGCKSLHPKICQLAEANTDAIFLNVNYDELKTMCCSLHVHVLPFFRFYKGTEGKLCSFSCTTATIKKFKDALTKYGGDRYCIGPAKGLERSELFKLASSGEVFLNLPFIEHREEEILQKGTTIAKR